jgi:hypothetical protein
VLGSQGSGSVGNDAVVALRLVDCSLATMCYGSDVPSAGKEWIEASAGAHRGVIDGFRAAVLDGQAL